MHIDFRSCSLTALLYRCRKMAETRLLWKSECCISLTLSDDKSFQGKTSNVSNVRPPGPKVQTTIHINKCSIKLEGFAILRSKVSKKVHKDQIQMLGISSYKSVTTSDVCQTVYQVTQPSKHRARRELALLATEDNPLACPLQLCCTS